MRKISTIFIIIFIIILNSKSVQAENKNNDPMLKDLKVNGKNINFEMFTTEYNLVFSEDIDKITINATPDDENAKVDIIGDLKLKDTSNKIEIKVTAEDEVTTQSYYIYALKGKKEETNSYLKELKIEGIELSPSFEKETINYACQYPKDWNKLTINALPEDSNATVEIIGDNNLKDELATIEIKVKSRNGKNIKTYYINAKKIIEESETELKNEENENKEPKKEDEAEIYNANNEQNANVLTNGEKTKETKHNKSEKLLLIVILTLAIIVILVGIVVIKKMEMKK